MAHTITRDIAYRHADTRMLGCLLAGARAGDAVGARPGILLVHDAFGLTADLVALAERYAALGYTVFAADVWGERFQPTTGEQIGRLIGSMAGDRDEWMSRIRAAHLAAAAQPEVDAARIAVVGYCVGGSSALEYVRTGGDVAGAVSIHGGLDLVAGDWSAATSTASVLLCTGAADPMAAPRHWQPIKAGLTDAGIDWEFDLYSGAQHAFTNPKADALGMPGAAYDARSAARAWARTVSFLGELFAEAPKSSSTGA
ncbi:dienelactone hydrolase family protein [Agromyces larvae]|uniref:Dienelactone hydrolase family protein n=1 Tax=Agromyces larvae TaxID=2929802 RepID=A0ABY4BVS0_9MICO|nr:dienelactone hydrolase family protein [Agromyces larvae]UOE43311.1 dienelactone hydrolase family protein [Agromyces larvae]